jgi:hypothetical protein
MFLNGMGGRESQSVRIDVFATRGFVNQGTRVQPAKKY